MDEQVDGSSAPFTYANVEDAASYEGFALKHLLGPLAAETGITIPVVKPELDHIKKFATPLNLLILALGVDGNYANVMPGTELGTGWHVARLTPQFRTAHTGKGSLSYEGAQFREYGMSLGPQQVLTAKYVIVIISGEKKRDLTNRLLAYDHFDPDFPLSIIFHPGVKDRVELYITNDVLAK
jgi:6-phosphogluconolactonase/glucosamine-6-phosphate isomerase/deaminase